MSNIVDKTPPDADILAMPIYIIDFREPTITHFSGDSQLVMGNVGEVSVRAYTHSDRVCGYRDGEKLYLLGKENWSSGENGNQYALRDIGKQGVVGNFVYHAYYRSMQSPPVFLTPQNQWSDRKAAIYDDWNIGCMSVAYPTSSGDYISPPDISDDSNLLKYREIRSFKWRFSQGVIDDWTLRLTTDIDTTALIRPISEGSADNYYVSYDDNVGGYRNGLLDVFALCEDIYEKATTDFNTRWTIRSGKWTEYPNSYASNLNHITVSNLLITEDLNAAKKYIETGEIPNDYYWDDPTIDPTQTDSKPGDDNNGGEGDSGSDTRDDIPVNAPTQTAVTLSNVHIYTLTKDQLRAFISDMWDFTWTEITTNMMTGIYNNLIDNVQSIRVFPFSKGELGTIGSTTGILCGWWVHSAENISVIANNTPPPPITVGSYGIKEVFGGWADYSPYTEIELYLPYAGTISLDTNLFMKHSVKVQYVIDVLTGIITYLISCDNTCVMSKSAKCAADVPISLSSGIDVFSDISKNVSGAVGNVLSGRPLGLINGSTQVASQQLINQTSESGKFYEPNKCFIRITRPAYTRSKQYDGVYGYPCYGSYKLSTLKGFTIVENYKGSYTKGIEKDEADEIKRLLEEGVYL